MKKRSLLFCLTIIMLLGFRSYAQTTVTISTGIGDTVCSGTYVTFTATPSVPGAYGYIWNVSGTYVGASTPTYTTNTLVSGDIVYCLLTNAAGDTILSVSDTITMTVNSLPTIFPITGVDSLCVGDSVQLSDAGGVGTWASGNTAFATISPTGMVTGIAPPTGGGGGAGPSVRIYYIYTNSCGSDSARIRMYVRVPAGPIRLVSNIICLDSAITLSDTARGGTWASSDSVIASVAFAFNPPPTPPSEKLTAHDTGTVTISYSLTNACGVFNETTNVKVINCDTTTAVNNVVSLANSCSIYPNPSTGSFSVMARSGKYTHASCIISDMVGQKVNGFTMDTNRETTVNMNVPSGLYFITITAGDEKYTSKIMIIQ